MTNAALIALAVVYLLVVIIAWRQAILASWMREEEARHAEERERWAASEARYQSRLRDKGHVLDTLGVRLAPRGEARE